MLLYTCPKDRDKQSTAKGHQHIDNSIKALHLNRVSGIIEISKLPYTRHKRKGGENMPSDKEMINNLIDNYTSLQRIKKADDVQKELEYQLKILKAKLESFGIITSDLDL